MKNKLNIQEDLERIVRANYYSEDFELISSFRAYEAEMSGEERDLLADVVFERLCAEGSLVDILFCSIIDVPSAVPVLAEKLSREPQVNQVTRSLIQALKRYSSDDAYVAVERFLDSDQEMDALQALAAIDFARTLPHLARLIKKDHYYGVMLQVFSERIKRVGLEPMIEELKKSSATNSASFRTCLQKALASKDSNYNPLNTDQRIALEKAFGLG